MTNREKAEKYANKIEKEQKTILELLEPHFGDKLEWDGVHLLMTGQTVMDNYCQPRYDNNYTNIYEQTEIDRETVFNKFGMLTFEELCDAIVKPWDVKEELKRVADEYDWISTRGFGGELELQYMQNTRYHIKNKNMVTLFGCFHFAGWGGKPIENDLIFNENNLCKLTEENFPEFERVIAEMDKQINHKWTLEWAIDDLFGTFTWLRKYGEGDIRYLGGLVVEPNIADVNLTRWHNGVLTGHPIFFFDNDESVELTGENYEEFKNVLKWYEDNIMNIKKPWEEE